MGHASDKQTEKCRRATKKESCTCRPAFAANQRRPGKACRGGRNRRRFNCQPNGRRPRCRRWRCRRILASPVDLAHLAISKDCWIPQVRPERFELPTFWFVAFFAAAAIKGPILIL